MINNSSSYLTFRIDAEVFGASVRNIQNIIEYSKLTKVPQMPACVIGVKNLCGMVLPVIDSRIKLGFPVSEITSNTSIIVLEINHGEKEIKVGLMVDEVLEVIEIDDAVIQPPPSIGIAFKPDIITGVFPADEKFVMLLDVHKVAVTDEILMIN